MYQLCVSYKILSKINAFCHVQVNSCTTPLVQLAIGQNTYTIKKEN